MRNSQVGNPQYKLETDLADFKTEANGGWVYGVPFNRLENKSVLLTINGRGTISKIEGEF